ISHHSFFDLSSLVYLHSSLFDLSSLVYHLSLVAHQLSHYMLSHLSLFDRYSIIARCSPLDLSSFIDIYLWFTTCHSSFIAIYLLFSTCHSSLAAQHLNNLNIILRLSPSCLTFLLPSSLAPTLTLFLLSSSLFSIPFTHLLTSSFSIKFHERHFSL